MKSFDTQIQGQIQGQKGEYTIQAYEVSVGELTISVHYKEPPQPRGYAAHFYTDFPSHHQELKQEKSNDTNPGYNGNYGGE
jgi:hypothetical protein